VPNGTHYDPRFLIFEYIFNVLLRNRQVEMINDFVNKMKNGKSCVQQMIMGGKIWAPTPTLAPPISKNTDLHSGKNNSSRPTAEPHIGRWKDASDPRDAICSLGAIS
jgi:hypothetical protein